MSDSFLISSIGVSANSIQSTGSSQSRQQETTSASANSNINTSYVSGDEFLSSAGNSCSFETFLAQQNALNETSYNKLTSSGASKLYEQVSSSITSLFSGNKSSKINQSANEDLISFTGSNDDESEYSDLKYFAEATGNSSITSALKEYEIMKSMLGVTDEEVYENY